MSQVPRFVLLGTMIVLPLLVLQGTRFGFELPKSHLAVLASAALLVLCLPRLPQLWRNSPREGKVLLVGAAVLAASVGLSTVLSDAWGMSLFGPEARFLGALVVLGSIGLVAVVPAALSDWRELEQLLVVLGGTILVFGLIAAAQQFGWELTPWPAGSPGGVLGTLGNSNFVGMFAALGAPLALGVWFVRPELRIPAAVLGVLAVATVVFAGSNLGLLGAAAGIGVVAVAVLPRRLPQVQSWLVAAAPLGGVLAGISVVMVGNAVGQQSAVARWRLWQSPFGMVADSPFSGVGWARVRANYLTFRQPDTVMLLPGGSEQRADSSHAWVIDLAANSGVIALSAMVVLLVVAGLVLRQAWLTFEGADGAMVAAIAGMLAAHGIGTSLAVPSVVGVWFGFLLIGLSLATVTVNRRRRAAKRRPSDGPTSSHDLAAGIAAVVIVGLLALPLRAFHLGAVDVSAALALFRMEEFETAVDAAEQAVDRTPWWAEPWMVLARIEDERADLDAARTALLKALEADPRNYDAMISIAQVYRAFGEHDEAEPWFERAAQIDPYGFQANFRRADWALEAGRLDIAREALETAALGLEPGGDGWRQYEDLTATLEFLGG